MSKSERQALEKVVAQLPAETVQRVIRHYGLDACAELVAAATPAQLAEVLDVDLWHGPRAGRDDVRFDADRFLEWVEHLVDADEAAPKKRRRRRRRRGGGPGEA